MYCATPKMIKEIDEYAIKKQGISAEELMYNAGVSAACAISDKYGKDSRAVVFCGSGNNGGDGYVIASELYERGFEVTVFEYGDKSAQSREASYFRSQFRKKTKKIHLLEDIEAVKQALSGADIIIEAVYGVGFHGQLPAIVSLAFEAANAAKAKRFAVDVPAGINGETGEAAEHTFRADTTLTMSYPKRGMFLYPAREFVGRVTVCDIGIDYAAVERSFGFDDWVCNDELLRQVLPRRHPDSNKGDFGRVLFICGSENMTGCAALAALGALRTGAGIAELAAPRSVIATVASSLYEPVYTEIPGAEEWDLITIERLVRRCEHADAVVIGCGLTSSKNVKLLISALSASEGCPLVLDADGLNSLEGDLSVISYAKREIVVTPHPKEFSRLSGISLSQIAQNRYGIAKGFAVDIKVTLLLKGADTIIASKDGGVCINTTGSSALAKGGSGDVLSGIIGSLIAQGMDVPTAAAAAAYLHGSAGDLLKETYSDYGCLPSELPAAAAKVIKSILK